MKTVDIGIYSYKITGEREEEAAAALEERIDYLDHLPGVRYYADELSDILNSFLTVPLRRGRRDAKIESFGIDGGANF